MDSDVSADAVRNDELLHDAGIDTGLSKPVKLAVAATVAVVLIVLAAVLLR
jgi:hypothetical protein